MINSDNNNNNNKPRRSLLPFSAVLSVILVSAFVISNTFISYVDAFTVGHRSTRRHCLVSGLKVSTSSDAATATAADGNDRDIDIPIDYETPEDAIINIKPKAMMRLRELRDKEQQKSTEGKEISLVLRMGVRNGGCSGLSYVMDFCSEDGITDDDQVDEYPAERLKCVVDAKSMLYLYGLELDYSDELIGGGFKFFNPNAEDSCGCGSSFGV